MNPDITFCIGGDCPQKNRCFRYTAEKYGRYNSFGNIPFRDGACEHFLDNQQQIAKQAYYIWLAQGKNPNADSKKYWYEAQALILEKLNEK